MSLLRPFVLVLTLGVLSAPLTPQSVVAWVSPNAATEARSTKLSRSPSAGTSSPEAGSTTMSLSTVGHYASSQSRIFEFSSRGYVCDRSGISR